MTARRILTQNPMAILGHPTDSSSVKRRICRHESPSELLSREANVAKAITVLRSGRGPFKGSTPDHHGCLIDCLPGFE
jgi:hypothetical protein